MVVPDELGSIAEPDFSKHILRIGGDLWTGGRSIVSNGWAAEWSD